MIVRVRTSLGVKRITLTGDTSLIRVKDLKNAIAAVTDVPTHLQTLSEDQKGENIYAPDDKLVCECGIEHGSIVYLVGRIEEEVIDRAFVSESGDIVPRSIIFNSYAFTQLSKFQAHCSLQS